MIMKSSYWETNRVLSTTDLLIVGGGFAGTTACERVMHPTLGVRTLKTRHRHGRRDRPPQWRSCRKDPCMNPSGAAALPLDIAAHSRDKAGTR